MACRSLIDAIDPVSGLLAAEKQSGYTASANATQGGPDAMGLFQALRTKLDEASLAFTALIAVLPSGTNKTNLTTAQTALNA